MDTKILDALSKGLLCAGLAYLAYSVKNMPKEVQADIKGLLEEGRLEDVKVIGEKFLPTGIPTHEEKKDDDCPEIKFISATE